MRRGFFLTFEGPDGSGKTTQLALLADSLALEGHDLVRVRQPGGTALGDRIRAILLDSKAEATLGPIAPRAELALMFADRAQSLAEVIEPALARGAIVLCDRYTDSSEAYQGAGRGLGIARVRALHAALCDDLQPDLTILLLPDLATALRRARGRNILQPESPQGDENRFEREGDAFFERVYDAYEAIARREPERVVVIRADVSVEAIGALVFAAVAERLRLWAHSG